MKPKASWSGTTRPPGRRRIGTVRTKRLAEHLGVRHKEVQAMLDETGSLIETTERLRIS